MWFGYDRLSVQHIFLYHIGRIMTLHDCMSYMSEV